MDPIDLPWRRSPAELASALERWVRHVIDADSSVVDVAAPDGSGMSSETLLFTVVRGDARRESFVARLEPDPRSYPVFPSYDLELQARCMRLVAEHTAAPVPTVRWIEHDTSWLGAPFLVMNRIDGRAPADIPPYAMTGWLFELSTEERAALQQNVIKTMVDLHRLTPQVADLSFLDRPEHGADPLSQILGAQREYYEWAREGVRYPLIDRTFAWLEAHRPTDVGPTVLVWGDARIGNILFAGTEPVAVLDWEMAALGPAEVDVAWLAWMHRFFDDLARKHGGPGLPGFLALDDVAAAYEQRSGRLLRDLDWYFVLAALRHAIITVRTSLRSVTFGTAELPADVDDVLHFRSTLEDLIA